MRTIRAEVQQYMSGPSREGSALKATFRFPPEFIGFQGHFPQKKILPGVCQIQLALSMIEKESGAPVSLKEIVLAKYFSPVSPDEDVNCMLGDLAGGSGEQVVKAAIFKASGKVAELKLRVVIGESKS